MKIRSPASTHKLWVDAVVVKRVIIYLIRMTIS